MTGSPRDTPGPVIEYRRLEAPVALPDDVLCAVTFGARSESVDDPRCVRVGLEPLAGGGLVEVWHASGRVHRGYDGLVRYTHDEHHLAAAIEIDESRYGGIAAAVASAIDSSASVARRASAMRSRNPTRRRLQSVGATVIARCRCTG